MIKRDWSKVVVIEPPKLFMVEVPVIDIDESSEAFTGHNDHITTEFNESEHRDTFEASNTNYISRS